MVANLTTKHFTCVLTILILTFSCACFSTSFAQPESPVDKVPDGFKVTTNMAYPTLVGIEATKPNTVKSCIDADPDIHLGYSWTAMTDQAADMLMKGQIAQEEQSSDNMGVKTEAIGKEDFKGGVLIYKKTTAVQVGTDCPDWVTYSGIWVGKYAAGYLAVGVSNLAGSQAPIKGWIAPLLK